MSNNSKKLGLKKLNTKQNRKLITKTKTSSDNLSFQFESFISSVNQDRNKDDSLFNVGSTSKIVQSPESETDCFEFSKNKVKEGYVYKNYMEISAYSSEKCSRKSLDLEGETVDENKKEAVSNDISSKYVRVSDLFNDSSFIFQNNASCSKKDIKKASEHVFIKALNENLDTKVDKKDDPNNTFVEIIAEPGVVVNDPVSTNGQVKDDESVEQPETTNQCPICLKKVSKYVSHMKSCAMKNNLNTQQLLSALKLHKKQLAERKELGLDVPAQTYRARVSPKRPRSNVNKGLGDVNLQLAMALSASLRSAEEDEVIQEAEALKAAGLTEEANQRLGTLEQFGFASAVTPQQRSVQGSSKLRPPLPSLLLGRSKEERERIVTEKIAIVLISEEENLILDSFTMREPTMKSKLLIKAWDKDCRLWGKAQCQAEEERSGFYVHSLCEFVTPCKMEVGAALRRLSQLPGRLNTPEKEESCDFSSISQTPSPKDNIYQVATPTRSSVTSQCLETIPTVVKSSTHVEVKDKLSLDWKQLVNNPEMSDLDIQCKDGVVPAHKLVLYVRCPKALQLINGESGKAIIVLENCSKLAAIALFEYIYAGSLGRIFNLDTDDINMLSKVVENLELFELKRDLMRRNEMRKGTGKNQQKHSKLKQDLFGNMNESLSGLDGIGNLSSFNNISSENQRSSLESSFQFPIEHKPCDNLDLECTSVSSGNRSPDMFGESTVADTKSFTQQTQHYLDELASLVSKSSGAINDKSRCLSGKKFSIDNSNLANDNLLSGSSANKSTSGKRKAVERNCSSDKESSVSKKPCSDQSSAKSEKSDEDVFDLTQSSKSSKEDKRQANFEKMDRELGNSNEILLLDESDSCEILNGDSLECLTQKNPSKPNSPSSVSLYEKTPVLQNQSAHQEYFEPAWDGYDDYLHFNYTPKSSPIKSFTDKLSEQKKSNNFSRGKSLTFSSLSPKSHATPDLQKSLLSSPKTSSDVNYISSDSNSPKKMSQKTLDEYSWTSKNVDSEIESTILKQSQKVTSSRLSSLFEPCVKSPTNSPMFLTARKSQEYKLRESKFENSTNQNSVDKLKKSPLKRDSLASMQRLLDDSFEINDTILINAEALLEAEKKGQTVVESVTPLSHQQKHFDNIICDTKACSVVVTPSTDIISYNSITPLPDYSAMKTPSLKRELSKFGLKPSLGKRKAKMMLRYIYDQTHPFVPDPGGEEEAEVFKQPTGQPLRSPAKSPQKTRGEVNTNSESDTEDSCSQKSTSTISSSVTLPEESFCEFDDVLTQEMCSTGDLKTAIRRLIVNNADLHRKVLMYEPIFLDEFMAMLKANGVKSKINDVMDYLDEQCITFRTNSWKATNEKRRQKNLKKKAKNQGESLKRRKKSPTNNSSSSEQPKPVKKRGRPRKTQAEQDL